METITKIDDSSVQIETTVTQTEVVNIDDLIYDRDSLVRTQDNNTQWAIDENAKIQILIDNLDSKIDRITNVGVKLSKISPIETEE